MKIALFLFLSFATFVCLSLAEAHDNCSWCHVDGAPNVGGLTTALPELCINCHPDRVGKSEHRIGMKAIFPMSVSLPLLNGMVTCTTCHDPHGNRATITRFDSERLCSACHTQ